MDLLAYAKNIAEQDRSAVGACRRAGRGFNYRHSRQHHSQAPHERCAGLRGRSVGAESVHVSAGRTSNRRPVPLVQPGQSLYALMGVSGGRYCSMGGGAPLTFAGQRIAGVGVSGGTVEQDIDILESALREAEATEHDRDEARGRRTPGSRRGSRQTLLWRPRLAAGHRLRIGRRLPGNPVHAARLGCSIIFGKNVTTAAPGSAKGLHLIVSDIEATRRDTAKPRGRYQ